MANKVAAEGAAKSGAAKAKKSAQTKNELDGVKLKIVQVRSAIGRDGRVRGTLCALGLGKIGNSAVVTGSPAIVGMIERVKSVLSVEMA